MSGSSSMRSLKRNITAWKRAKPVTLELPSGSVVEVKRVSLSALLSKGMLPHSFFTASVGRVKAHMTDEEKKAIVAETERMLAKDPKLAGETITTARLVAKDALVWPRVVEAPSESEDEVTIDQIPDEDLFAIMRFALLDAPVATTDGEVPAESLEGFRDVAPVHGGGEGGADVRAEA